MLFQTSSVYCPRFQRDLLLVNFKQTVLDFLGRFDLEVRKYPGMPFKTMPTFQLVVRYHMAKTSEELVFVQIGANDGILGDPLRQFVITYGWSGVLVEPQFTVYQKLVSNYTAHKSRLKFENIAISNHSDSIVMFRPRQNHESDDLHGADVVSVNRRVTARQLKTRGYELESFEVKCMTLDGLLEKHGIRELDVLQIDTEGHDWSVLSSLSLEKVSPAIIQFEHGHLTRAECRKIAAHLNDFGYFTYWGGRQHDSVSVRKDFFS